MRIDSCRNCGKEMEPLKRCEKCNDVEFFQCPKCGWVDGEKVHSHTIA